ncbi:hypothetical protein D0Y65_011935 [Glycine soja]|uniref:Uncharacterized protein n=1 Tax=Glycine soja TaxID=3848 RepID=A0A445KMK8_GLYSO|nr:hypothetical protein D0Y65_011935 [Glycine soja]
MPRVHVPQLLQPPGRRHTCRTTFAYRKYRHCFPGIHFRSKEGSLPSRDWYDISFLLSLYYSHKGNFVNLCSVFMICRILFRKFDKNRV